MNDICPAIFSNNHLFVLRAIILNGNPLSLLSERIYSAKTGRVETEMFELSQDVGGRLATRPQ